MRFAHVWRGATLLLVITMLGATGARAQETTKPADAPAAAQPPRIGISPVAIVQRVRTILDGLSLSAEQKATLAPVLTKAEADAIDLEKQLDGVRGRERMQQIAPFMRDLREQVTAVLTEEQKQALAQQLRFGGSTPGGRLEAFKQAVAKLDLSPEQQKKIGDLIADTQKKAQDLRQKAGGGGGGDVQSDLRTLLQDFRRQVQEILTPDQQAKLRELMQAQGGPAAGRGPAGARRPNDDPAEKPDAPDGMKKESTPPPAAPTTAPGAAAATPAAPVDQPKPDDPPIAVGSTVPDLQLRGLDDRIVRLSSLKGRVLVIEFGSYTCPTFRQKARAMEELKSAESAKAAFFLIYTREAHPAGGWEVDRNKSDGISIPQPPDEAARRSIAAKARDALHVTFPVFVDAMDDAAATAFGGFPNAAVVVSKEGTIAARQQWTDPSGLRRLIDDAVTARGTR